MSWNGISVPAARPKAVVNVLTRAINEVLPSHDVQEKVSKLGMEMRGSTPEAMTERMKSDIVRAEIGLAEALHTPDTLVTELNR